MIVDEGLQSNIDEKAKVTLQKMRFKWLNERVSSIEQFIKSGNVHYSEPNAQ